jgi:hypothetical protein
MDPGKWLPPKMLALALTPLELVMDWNWELAVDWLRYAPILKDRKSGL